MPLPEIVLDIDVDAEPRPEYEASYQITGTLPGSSATYRYRADEVSRVVERLIRIGCPNITIAWSCVDHAAAAPVGTGLSSSQLSALADIRIKYADDSEVVRDFETVLGIQ